MIIKMLESIFQYIGEGFARIFGPSNDECPSIGVQPFSGVIYHANSKLDWFDW
ncbi:hypothetical protein [Myxosarcina sp. GI1]|uniref:hypothetical protein n=1 Tax=Myxosarcina sp. GI1 TaxID=1541065 RepID=UPI00155AFF8E|nr:hypothetical protein [Myxosarcina sp. GI1]